MFNIFFFKYRTVYEIKWKNLVEPDRPQITIWCMRFACWISKATNKHSDCVMFIALPLQQWFTNAPQCYVLLTLTV